MVRSGLLSFEPVRVKFQFSESPFAYIKPLIVTMPFTIPSNQTHFFNTELSRSKCIKDKRGILLNNFNPIDIMENVFDFFI